VRWIFGGTHTLEHQPLWRILHRLRLSVRLIISCFSLWLTPPLGGQKNVFFFFSFFLSFVYCSTAGYTTYKCDEEPCNEVKSFPEGDNNKSCSFVRSFQSLQQKKKNLMCRINNENSIHGILLVHYFSQ
jgi:hypothetical protein